MSVESYPRFMEPSAIASTSQARCYTPNHRSEASLVKAEARTPILPAYQSFPHPYNAHESTADTHIDSNMSSTLISSPSSRHLRPPALQPSSSHLNPNTATLFSQPQYLPQTHHPQDVLPLLVNRSLPNDSQETAGQHGYSRPPHHSQLSSTPSHHHDSLNSSWTLSHPVFTTTSALAAHHGIPQSLPPVPRTTRYQQEKPAPPSSSTSPAPNTDFDSLCSSYLSMLSQKSEDRIPAVNTTAMDSVGSNDAAAVQALIEVLQGEFESLIFRMTRSDSSGVLIASPEFRDLPGDFGSEFLTSPLDESPWEEMLTTPALESGDMSADILTSPAIIDTDDFGLSGMPLFADALSYNRTLEPMKTSPPAPVVQHPLFDGNLYTMPSPETPSLDPTSIHASPNAPPLDTPMLSPSSGSRRKNQPTGTRKNITPEALVPYDAPIQPRKYITPSATSRKEVPAVFAKKRARSIAFEEDEEDDLVSGVDLDAIEAKRRQNTLAARRSRRRKLEYQRELESSVEKEKEEKDQWRTKALFYKALLESHGHDVPAI
ncbi:hypothetical protein EIP86_002474 [Pleurotus ostreatoroseus]|nr:hypothetical protein EIP86_002474 [Pleurotus ostreatoroseus]